jgi:hypothetical protein
MPRGVLCFIFNLRIKENGSITQIHWWLLWSFLLNHEICFFTHITSYILAQLSVVSTTANESILAPFSKQTESSHSPREIGRPTTSHWWLGLAILGFACPDLAADRCPNLNTYKSHRFEWQVKQHKGQCYSNRHIFTTFCILRLTLTQLIVYKHTYTISTNLTLASWKGLLGPHSSVGHTYYSM